MAFHDVLFPEDISYGSAGGPGFRTQIIELDSGREVRSSQWLQPLYRFDVRYGIREYEALYSVQKFYMARRGSLHTFRFKDWLNYTSRADGTSAPTYEDQLLIASAEGGETEVQLVVRHLSGPSELVRPITKPVLGTVQIGVNGTALDDADFTVNYDTGVVTVPELDAADAVTAGFEFHNHVRFDNETDEWLSATLEAFNDGSIRSIGLREVRDEVTFYDLYNTGGSMEYSLTQTFNIPVNQARILVFKPLLAHRDVVLPNPVAMNLPTGRSLYEIFNESDTYNVVIKDHTGTTVATVTPGKVMTVSLVRTSGGSKVWYAY